MLEIVPNVHPLLVHFPIALTTVAAAFLLAARIRRSAPGVAQWAAVGHWTLWLSALSALFAAFFGWQAFATVDHDGAGHVAMSLHRNWALPTTLALLVVAALDRWRCRADQPAAWPTTLAVVLLLGAMTVTGWLGGEAVYRHGIGVLAQPRDAAVAVETNPPGEPAPPATQNIAPEPAAGKTPERVEHGHAKDGHQHQH